MKCPADVYAVSCRPYRGIPDLTTRSTTAPSWSPATDVFACTTTKINLSVSLAGQAVGGKEVDHGIWLVGFMEYDRGDTPVVHHYFDFR